MSAYLNNLLTTTTSRYNSLRRQLLSDAADGDTEDDSHICRVLRAYYTEKGSPFPQWLPPDPKAPQPAPAQFSSGRQYGNMGQPQMGRGGGGGGAIGDLWDAPAQPQQQQEPLSLRRAQGRGGGGGRRPLGDSYTPEPQSQGRPLPSQRAGSYQSGPSFRQPEPSPPPSAGGGSAQDRLKARLWGSGRSTTSVNSQSAPSSQNTSPAVTPGMRSPFDRSSGGGGGGGGGGGRLPYPDDRSSGYSSGGGRQQNDYKMSSNSPWAGNDDPYTPSGGGYGGQQRQPPSGGRVGLPSGPRMR